MCYLFCFSKYIIIVNTKTPQRAPQSPRNPPETPKPLKTKKTHCDPKANGCVLKILKKY